MHEGLEIKPENKRNLADNQKERRVLEVARLGNLENLGTPANVKVNLSAGVVRVVRDVRVVQVVGVRVVQVVGVRVVGDVVVVDEEVAVRGVIGHSGVKSVNMF